MYCYGSPASQVASQRRVTALRTYVECFLGISRCDILCCLCCQGKKRHEHSLKVSLLCGLLVRCPTACTRRHSGEKHKTIQKTLLFFACSWCAPKPATYSRCGTFLYFQCCISQVCLHRVRSAHVLCSRCIVMGHQRAKLHHKGE